MLVPDFEKLFKRDSKIWGVYKVLRDMQWHCRECEYQHVGTTQIAGGAGIQGLERGTRSRQGLAIDSGNHFCKKCKRQTRQDKWNGQFMTGTQAASMPTSFVKRAALLLGHRDIVEGTERPVNQLTLDHKLPMLRWSGVIEMEQTDYGAMTDDDIRQNFQLLKKSNGSVSHNLLKSRACEKCYKNGHRGKPFGIDFFYSGDKDWQPTEKEDPSGCIGCGWFDFAEWRKNLNKRLMDE